MSIFLALLGIALVAAAVLEALLRIPGALPRATPNTRSLHTVPVPRGGGLALWCALLPMLYLLPGRKDWLLPLLAVVIVSWVEDRRGLPAALRLAVHLAAAIAWVTLAGTPHPVLAVLAIAWMTNLFNFMDGSDGLAAVMTAVGFAAYGAASFAAGDGGWPIPLATAVAMLPLLVRNWPPARVFIGDVGAVPLGFLAGVMGVAGWQDGDWAPWFPVLVFLPFIADATLTLLRRAAAGRRVWQAHREHCYQHVVQLGWGHRGTLFAYGALMLCCATAAVACLWRWPQWGNALLAVAAATSALLYLLIEYHWSRKGGG